MSAALTDKLLKVGVAGTLTQMTSPGKALAASSFNVGSGTNYPTDTAFIVAVRTVDDDGVEVDDTYTEWIATISGTTLTINPVPVYGDDQVYSAGANTQVFIPVSAYGHNLLIDALLNEHDQAGAHTDITADSLSIDSQTWASLITGWLEAGESWSYASWSSTTKIGTITVPTDATTKYSAGMRIRISQSTGGTKYGIITKVESTTLTVYFGTDYTLNNEAITAPYYSVQKAPFGFPTSPAKWTQTTSTTTQRTTTSTSFATLTDNLVIGIGEWYLSLSAVIGQNSSSTQREAYITLSSDTSTETDADLTLNHRGSASQNSRGNGYREKLKSITAQTTMTALGKTSNADNTAIMYNDAVTGYIKARCAYL